LADAFGAFCLFRRILHFSAGTSHPSVILRFSFGHPSVISGDPTKSPANCGAFTSLLLFIIQVIVESAPHHTCKETEFLDRNELELLFLKYGAHS